MVVQCKEGVAVGFEALQVLALGASVIILVLYAPIKFHTVAIETLDEFTVLGARGTEAGYVQGT